MRTDASRGCSSSTTTPPSPRSSVATSTREGFAVEIAGDGAVGARTGAADPPDLVVLDLMLPGLDGLEVCRRLRAPGAGPGGHADRQGEEDDRIAGLELGADDYVAKPFSPRELTARVKAVLRRARGPLAPAADADLLRAGDLDRRRRRARGARRRRVVALTAGVRAAGLPDAPPRAGLPPRGAARAGVGLDLRRHLDRHRPRPPAPGEDRADPDHPGTS